MLASGLASAGAWRNYRHDAAHTGNNADEVLDPASLTLAWEKQVGNVQASFWSVPCVVSRMLLVATTSGAAKYLRAFSLENGQLVWERQLQSWYLPLGPVVAGPRLILSLDHPARLEAYDLATGASLWKSQPLGSANVASTPVVSGNLAYVTADNSVYAVNLKSGSAAWSTDVAGGGSGPAISNGLLFTSSAGHRYGIEARSGTYLWHDYSDVSGGGGAVPAVGEYVYVVDRDWDLSFYPPTVFAFEPETGQLAWKRSFAATGLSELALTDDAVYLTDRQILRAINPSTGDDLWNFVADGPMWLAPIVAGPYLFVASSIQTYALYIPTRTVVWTSDLAGQTVVSQGWVVISSYSGVVRVYRSGENDDRASR